MYAYILHTGTHMIYPTPMMKSSIESSRLSSSLPNLSRLQALLLFLLYFPNSVAIPEPCPPISGHPQGPPLLFSPDPLFNYAWEAATNFSQLQVYTVAKAPREKIFASPPQAFVNLKSLSSVDMKTTIYVHGPGSLRVDFGLERAAWLELTSPDLCAVKSAVWGSISEYSEPFEGKTKQFRSYNGCKAFRLEPNPELYEGVRFAWVIVKRNVSFTITSLRLVAQVKPMNYSASFRSSDEVLTRSWYTGAYAARLNTMSTFFSSILIDRGDRVAIQGDAYPTMAAAMTAFPSAALFDLVHTMLRRLDSSRPGNVVPDKSLLAYPIYWTLSVNRWYMATGDSRFKKLIADVDQILNATRSSFGERPAIIFMGWDDRLGAGFCGNSCPMEAQLAYASLVVRAMKDFSTSLGHIGDLQMAQKYSRLAQAFTEEIRGSPEFYKGYGMHAAGNAMWAGVVRGEELDALRVQAMNDRVTICSWSAFNQYFMLEGMTKMSQGKDRAIEVVHICWAPMLTLSKGCFWELFSPEWVNFMAPGTKPPTRPSLCHPWSSGVTPWLTDHVLGIQPLTPGFAEYNVAPHVSTRHPHVQGHVDTVKGRIALNASLRFTSPRSSPSIHVQLSNPSIAFVAFPMLWEDNPGCKLQQIASDALGASLAYSIREEDGKSIAVLGPLKAVNLAIVVSYSGTCVPGVEPQRDNVVSSQTDNKREKSSSYGLTMHPFLPPASYRTTGVLNRNVKGNWRKYGFGSVGFTLFAYGHGQDVVRIPPTSPVQSIKTFRSTGRRRREYLGSSSGNETYLEDPRGGSARALGFVTDGGDGSQGIVIDLVVDKGVEFTARLYMVAETRKSKQAIRVVDGEDFGIIATTPLVDNFHDGVYYVVTYNNSIRFRVMSIEDDNTVSALFVNMRREVSEDGLAAFTLKK